jgi:hypothetical protein
MAVNRMVGCEQVTCPLADNDTPGIDALLCTVA